MASKGLAIKGKHGVILKGNMVVLGEFHYLLVVFLRETGQ